MGHVRVVFTGQGPSGLPVDRAVNVWHFETFSTYSDDEDACASAIANFYNVPASGATHAVGEYLSPWVDRDATVTTYDMESPPPRIPMIRNITLPASIGASGLPNEVAVCLSFTGDPPHTPRRRGRIFLGPVANAADLQQPASITADGKIHPTCRGDVASSALQLASLAGDVHWAIRSSKPAINYVIVTAGWVDNAFDTQRRRGEAADTRTVWSVP